MRVLRQYAELLITHRTDQTKHRKANARTDVWKLTCYNLPKTDYNSEAVSLKIYSAWSHGDQGMEDSQGNKSVHSGKGSARIQERKAAYTSVKP
ncbi:unnamed protein product [Microthlaspi erraticum]|uniref:Uncharacterized protein n=1 Tax=Microthlaspi erraticum TaxID=1685480 RepID=A0A6D2KKK2_9BRAS|nr:unnamed protein product [Microthlaspi erraticum]